MVVVVVVVLVVVMVVVVMTVVVVVIAIKSTALLIMPLPPSPQEKTVEEYKRLLDAFIKKNKDLESLISTLQGQVRGSYMRRS